MGTSIEHTVTISRPPEAVYAYFLDLDRNASDPGVASATRVPPGPTAAGTEFRFTHERGPDTSVRFDALEPSRRIRFHGKVGPLAPVGDLVFEPLDDSTRLTVRVDPRPATVLRPFSPLIRRRGHQVWEARFARVKAALEAPTPQRGPGSGTRA
jgi:hypothetical protein